MANDSLTTIYCAKKLSPHLESLKKNASNILNRKDEEDVHDIRVASRRIRTILDIFEKELPNKKIKEWTSAIKRITKSFGAVRDLDVQLISLEKISRKVTDQKIRKGIHRVKLRLSQKREKKQQNTIKTTNEVLKSPILEEMKDWANKELENETESEFISSEDLFSLAYKKIQSRLDEFLFFEVFIFDPSRVTELHQMRISAKRLRYALEIFSELFEGKIEFALDVAREAQEILGKIHDADVWLEFLPNFLVEEEKRIFNFYGYKNPHMRIAPGINYLLQNRKLERAKLYKHFIKIWKIWKLDETWLNLRKVVFLTSLEPPPTEIEESIDPSETIESGEVNSDAP